MDVQQQRQRALLEAKLAARKKKKLKNLKEKHEEDLHKEVKEQQKEKEEAISKTMQQREEDILTRVLNSGNRRKAKTIIEKILNPRHTQEVVSQLQDNFADVNKELSEVSSHLSFMRFFYNSIALPLSFLVSRD